VVELAAAVCERHDGRDLDDLHSCRDLLQEMNITPCGRTRALL